MRTAAFILFTLVTAAAAALSSLVATRYLGLERETTELRSQLDEIRLERKRQEEEKIALRLEKERVQADLEARFAEERAQLEECGNQREQQFQEILATLLNLQKRIIDLQVQSAPSAAMEKTEPRQGQAAPAPQSAPEKPAAVPSEPSAQQQHPKATDVPHGAIPTPEQEAKKLNKVQ